MLVLSIILISLALVFYTIGVWAEHRQKELRWWHVGAFALGFLADFSGTIAMTVIANSGEVTRVAKDSFLTQAMATTGLVALILMGLHLAWAVITMIRNRPNEKKTFHKFSVIVWAIWLVPYFTGAAAAMI